MSEFSTPSLVQKRQLNTILARKNWFTRYSACLNRIVHQTLSFAKCEFLSCPCSAEKFGIWNFQLIENDFSSNQCPVARFRDDVNGVPHTEHYSMGGGPWVSFI